MIKKKNHSHANANRRKGILYFLIILLLYINLMTLLLSNRPIYMQKDSILDGSSQRPIYPQSPPPQVTGLVVLVIPAENRLDLSWDTLSAAAGYQVFRNDSSGGNGNFSWIADVAMNYYNDSNVQAGLTYFYQVRAYNNLTEYGQNSTALSGIPSPDTTPPSQVTGLTVNNDGAGEILNLTWNENPALDLQCYRIYRNSTTQAWLFVANSTSNFYRDTGLTENQTYFYNVTAVDDAENEGPASNIANGTPIDIKAPGPPTIIEPVSKSGRTAILIIKSPSDLDVLSYNIYRSNVSGFILDNSTLLASYWPKTGLFTTYLDVNLALGAYYYKVVALDEKYQASLPSNEALIMITLFAPVWVSITDNTNGDLTLKWRDNATNLPYTVIGWYRIYRMNISNPILSYIGNVSSLGVYPVTYQYFDYGLPNGNWAYYLTTVDKFYGESALSIAYPVLVNDVGPPSAPTGLQNITPNGLPNVTIAWTRPTDLNNGSDVFRYEIYISRTPITNITGLLPNATIYGLGWHPDKTIRDLYYPLTSYTFYNLSDDTYYMVVIAFDEDNHSSALSSMISYTVDTTQPTIYENTLQYPTRLHAGKEGRINITLYERNGITSVNIRYTVDGFTYSTASMSVIADFSNGTQIYTGAIDGQEAGRTISFTINVIDSFGNSRTSSIFSYQVAGEETPWTLIIVAIAAIAAGAIASEITLTHIRSRKKQKSGSEKNWHQRIYHLYLYKPEAGVLIYDYTFRTDESADNTCPANLASASLEGISMIIQEITKQETKLKILEQENVTILLEYGKYVNAALVVQENLMTPRKKLKELIEAVETSYQKELETFAGNVDAFSQVGKLVERVFQTDK